MWCQYPPDDCTCKWVNYSDHGGWDLRSRDPRCPRHGYETGPALGSGNHPAGDQNGPADMTMYDQHRSDD